jgi:hypothetical protein
MMTKVGLVDKRLANAPTPVCSARLYGKATRRPWRTNPKADPMPKFFMATFPDQVVSVGMLHSPTPGLIAQMGVG